MGPNGRVDGRVGKRLVAPGGIEGLNAAGLVAAGLDHRLLGFEDGQGIQVA